MRWLKMTNRKCHLQQSLHMAAAITLPRTWFWINQHSVSSNPLFYSFRQVLYYARDMFLKNTAQIKVAQIKHKIPIEHSLFPVEVRGLTASSHMLYDYTTSGHRDL